MLAAFVGCAGVGKNTIIKELINLYPDLYAIFPTLTTRAMRPGEVEGNPYHFVTKERFLELLNEGEIYEWQQIHDGNYYGGSRQVLRKHLASGKTLIKDIDVLGAETYKQKLGDITKILSVFLYVDDLNVLLERMRSRGDDEENIKVRAGRFQMEMESSVNSDYMVSNDVIRDTADEIHCLLTNENEKGGLYRPVQGAHVPTKDEIAFEEELLLNGKAPAPVELVFNGSELMIKSSAARYAAAKRRGAFIQKVVRTLTDASLKPADISLEGWEEKIFNIK